MTYGYGYGCCGWVHERLPDPVQQYYYVNQGPTYSGPGNWAPVPTYQEDSYEDAAVEAPTYYGYRAHPHYHAWHGYYHAPHGHPYGYRHAYMPHGYYAPHHYGYHEYPLRRYY